MGTASSKFGGNETLNACRLLSADEVVHLLKVSRTTLYSLAARKLNPIPSVKIGKSRRYPFDKVLGWMENLEK